MKNLSVTALFITASALYSCQPNSESAQTKLDESENLTAEMAEAEEGQPESYGQSIQPGNAMELTEALNLLNNQDSVMVKISGNAVESCEKKGCWLTLQNGDKPEIRVTFKDYSFFVPKDLDGEKVVMEGVLKKKTSSVEELRHYAEDAGKTQEQIAAITEPETSATFIADGVLVYRN